MPGAPGRGPPPDRPRRAPPHPRRALLRDPAARRVHRLPRPRARRNGRTPPARSYEEHVRAAAGRQREAGLAYWQRELDDASFDVPCPASPGPAPGAATRAASCAGPSAPTSPSGYAPTAALRDTPLLHPARAVRRTPAPPQRTRRPRHRHRGRQPPRGLRADHRHVRQHHPLRLRLDPEAGADAVVDEVTDSLIRALPHQDVPVQVLTRALGLHTTGADNPLFNVMFSAHDATLPEVEVPGLEVSLYEGFNTGTTRFDLDLVLLPDDRRVVGPRQGPAGMTLVWDYDRDLFTEDTARLLADRFLDLLRAYLDAPATPLASLAPQPQPARPAAPAIAPESALNPLAGQEAGRAAVVSGARTITFGELDQQVDALAGKLRAAGVTEGQPVAAVLPRGVDTLVTLLACLRLGAVYCPLSPNDPAARLETLLHRLRPALVLATRDSALALPAEGLPLALLDGPAFPAAEPAGRLAGAAYVIHTSGSTGLPKPVVVGRAALAHHATAVAARFALTTEDRVLLFAQPSFDVALEEVLPSLLAGATLVVPQREVPTGTELVAVLASRRVTVANLPTSYLLAVRQELCEALGDGRWSPRLLVLGGERLPADALRELLGATDATVLNAYGVTEATITSTVHELDRAALADGTEVPLGTELPGVRVHVLDPGLRPLPDGAVGELALAGAGLADGYLHADDTTAERFVAVPALGGARVYRTGDLGHRGPDGLVHFLGRRDNQIKLRGYRIELEEIEAAASHELGGRSCAVVLDEKAPGGPRLIGFLEGGAEPDQQALHTALSQRLPTALVPARWIRLDAMPTLPGGKPHRTALAAAAAALPGADAAGPQATEDQDPAVALLAEGWREVLGHDRFAPDSHFFQVGGHSLLAAQLAAWLEPRLGQRPALRVLFQNPVLADQARALGEVAR
ncbi:amino acid adenylation domain-containing protein [Streptomyces stramineus]